MGQRVSRRNVLALGVVGVALAGCTPSQTRPTPTRTPVGPPDWAALAASITGTLLRPGQAGYDQVRLTENPSYDGARPLAVLTAKSPADVASGLKFAAKYSVPLALRSGGHSYPGWSSGGAAGTGMPSSLVIDTRGMSQVILNSDGTVTVGAGASLADVYSTIGTAGRAIAAGSCATVGAAGLTLGGGVGVLVRAYGLTCDQVTSFQVVTADGAVRTASSTSNPDLYWACRGGGGGHLGVVTTITYRTVAAPTVTTFYLSWAMASAASVIAAWQDWAPTADPRLWSTLKLLGGQSHSGGPGISMSGTWIGPASELNAQFAPFLSAANAPLSERDVNTQTYLQAMLGYAGCGHIPIAQCQTGPGGALTREPYANTSHVAYTKLDSDGIADLIAQVQGAQNVVGMTEGGISMDALGGAVATLAAGATAFVHRAALMTVQYTSTFAVGADPGPYFSYVRGFRAAMTPHWGDSAYVSYADAAIQNSSAAYFGANASRLASIARTYDPHGLFTQPQPY
jgi:FAD binding domain/Berberine and berberine like